MSKHKKRIFAVVAAALLLCLVAAAAGLLGGTARSSKGEQFAEKRVLAFAEAANANDPEKVYDFLTEELRSLCSREEFAANWADERTYPYLIPFWIFYRGIELDTEQTAGTATFERAARLPGQFEQYGLVYERGGYYLDAFRTIADGSYIEIFERLK